MNDLAALATAVTRIKAAIETDEPLPDRLAAAQMIVQETRPQAEESTYSTRALQDRTTRQRAQLAVLADPVTTFTALRLGDRPQLGDGQQIKGFGSLVRTPAPSYSFCIRPNPVIQAARSHAEMNLRKIRTCRNIAGLDLHLDPYAMPTTAEASLDFLAMPSSQPSLQPLPYRYAVLIERAKQLVDLSKQIESSMLSSLENVDQAQYEEFKARQDLTLAQAGVRMKDLQLVAATDGVATASGSASVPSSRARTTAPARRGPEPGRGRGSRGDGRHPDRPDRRDLQRGDGRRMGRRGGAGLRAAGRAVLAMASYERRADDWAASSESSPTRTCRSPSSRPCSRGTAAGRRPGSRHRGAAGRSRRGGAQLHLDQKFSSDDLYEWMGGVLEQVYRFFLQQATSMAQLAEAQLAFERQEVPPAVHPGRLLGAPAPPIHRRRGASPQAPNLHGLTGSARLLRDVYELDQYAFATNQRKLQLTKTISLAAGRPVRVPSGSGDSGVLAFATPMALFDREFPGHYLRLIKPGADVGDRADPADPGHPGHPGDDRYLASRHRRDGVRDGGDPARPRVGGAHLADERHPACSNSTPSRSCSSRSKASASTRLGVPAPQGRPTRSTTDAIPTSWSPSTTPRSTASTTASRCGRLDRTSAPTGRSASDTTSPTPGTTCTTPSCCPKPSRFVVRFRTDREDFPPNLDGLTIDQVVLYFATRDGNLPIGNVTLQFTPDLPDLAGNRTPVGGDAQPVSGKISTRAGAWTPLIGQRLPGHWMISLRPADNDPQKTQKLAAIRAWFASEAKERRCDDIILAVSYSARTPVCAGAVSGPEQLISLRRVGERFAVSARRSARIRRPAPPT